MNFAARFALLLGALAAAPAGAAAGDPPPDLDRAITRCHELVVAERFPAAEKALRKLFVDFENDPRVRARLRQIEDDLKVCLYRQSAQPLTGFALFNEKCELKQSTRDVTFRFGTPAGPHWRKSGNTFTFSVRFEGPVTLEFSSPLIDTDGNGISAFACWEPDAGTGYVACPGAYEPPTSSSITQNALVVDSSITKLSPKEDKQLSVRAANESTSGCRRGNPMRVTLARKSNRIEVKIGDKVTVHASDGSFTSGLVGILASAPTGISIEGRIEAAAYQTLCAAYYARWFAVWEKGWGARRDAEIPAWARTSGGPAAPKAGAAADLPADAPAEEAAEIAAIVEAAIRGDAAAAARAEAAASISGPDTALYLRGVAAFVTGAELSAFERFDALAASAPEFVPARLFRAMVHLALRNADEARADLAWVLERRPADTRAVLAAVRLAMYEEDVPRAVQILAKAAENGAPEKELAEVGGWVHRASRGPNFAQRFEASTAHFVVVSDVSRKVCTEVGAILEAMQPKYAEATRTAPFGAPKSRVYVFSGHASYLAYTADLHVRADSTAGVYLPMLRELVIWVPESSADFEDTVRHEGFHQYLHRLTDEPPIWFNEGYAEFLASGGLDAPRERPGDREVVGGFVPVAKLIAMRQGEFMKSPRLSYTQARWLVDVLKRTKTEKLKRVLRDYAAAICGGLSQDEANAKVFAPVLDLLEAEFRSSW